MTTVYKYENNTLSFCSEDEYYNLDCIDSKDTSYLFCAKNPFHKEIVGYEKNCSKSHPEYLVADKGFFMALNMVDAPKKEFFADKMVYAGLDFIDRELAKNKDVVVVCNQGESRSATMCLMYMMAHGDFDKSMSHSDVFNKYKEIAPNWKPNNGILEYCVDFWEKIRQEEN